MNTNTLAHASSLSDRDLLARLGALAHREREASVELVAHLAALDSRPSLYAIEGYGSLFGYCTQALRLSEDAAVTRIEAARACRRFPAILDLLASGRLSLTSVRVLARHLTKDNHESVLARASGRSRREVEALVAELAPRPDVAATVRRLPAPRISEDTPAPPAQEPGSLQPGPTVPPNVRLATSSAALVPLAPRPVVQATAPARYRIQFTVGEETHERLRKLQTLLRREIPDGDPAAIVDRALALLLEKVETAKLGAAAKPRPRLSPPIRPGTDRVASARSRTIPRHVRRAVWRRDEGQCAFMAKDGHRCTERTFLELHHIHPFARGGPSTVANIALRCRRHNQHEGEIVFGPRARGKESRQGSLPVGHDPTTDA